MNSNDIQNLFKMIEDVFPLPTINDFNGSHHFFLNRQTKKVSLVIWYSLLDEIRYIDLTLENENLTKQLFLEIKKSVDEENKKLIKNHQDGFNTVFNPGRGN
jgi:hypothetical protein